MVSKTITLSSNSEFEQSSRFYFTWSAALIVPAIATQTKAPNKKFFIKIKINWFKKI